jgi:hypothetical protein
MLAAPELVVAEIVELLHEIQVAPELQHWMLADRMMRGEESSKFEARHDVYSPERNLPCCPMPKGSRGEAIRWQGYVLAGGKAIVTRLTDLRQNAAMRAADAWQKAGIWRHGSVRSVPRVPAGGLKNPRGMTPVRSRNRRRCR